MPAVPYFNRGEPFDDQGTANNYTAALYGGRTFGDWALRLGASYGRHDVGTTRQVAFTGFADSDRANYTAQTAQGFGELGYDLKLDSVAVEPFANFAYTSEQVPGFTEQGGAAALQVQPNNSRLGTSTLGVRVTKLLSFPDPGGPVLQGMIGWQHNAGDVTPQDNVSFISGGGAPFGIDGTPLATDALVLDTGLDFAITDRLTLGLAFTGQFSGAAQDQAVRGVLSFRL